MKKRADGRYCKQILIGYKPDGTRRMRTIYGKTIKEVEKKLSEIHKQIDLGINLSDDLTVCQWGDTWLKTFKTDIANNTYVRYSGIVRNQINPIIGDLPLTGVRLHTLQKMINELSEQYAPATVKKIKDVLHQMFEQAVRSQYIAINPAECIAIPKFHQKNREVISMEHVKIIEEFCKDYKHGTFVMTLLYTGMRRGEILALRVQDIDFENEMIFVTKAVEFICNTPNIKTPKTPKSNRAIPILNPLIPYLKKAVEGKEKTEFVFTGYDGNLYTKSSIQRLFKAFNRDYNRYINRSKAEEEHETVHFTMHQFRHTFCTMMYDAGVDVKTAQDILGHSSVNVTLDIYTHLSREKKNINIDKMNSYIESQLKA
ncbi:MAG: site-specific integrase [Ruminococcaceae bacterium]|nr:site-specific integrase [Oscillospiraceae bacterium]